MSAGSGAAFETDLLSMILQSGPVVQAVLLLLIILSVMSWSVTIAKFLYFRRANQASLEFRSIFWETRDFSRVSDSVRRLAASPLTSIFESGVREAKAQFQTADGGALKAGKKSVAAVEQAMRRSEQEEAMRLEKGNTFLASVASSAPFIGLFGTVWGIMNAFHGLGMGGASTLQAVAPGISEALVATAVGLAAAIPAAVAYNYFAVAVRQFRESMHHFTEDFMTFTRDGLASNGEG